MANVTIQYTADIQQLNAKLDQIIQKQEQLISSSKKAGDEMSNASKKAASETVKLESTLSNLQGMIASAFSVGVIINFTKNLVDAERRLELIQNRLNFVAGSVEKGAALFERLTAASNKLGINIEVLSEGFAAFGISATQAGFSARKAEDIFIKMSAGLRAAGATSLQSQRAFLALQQMIDKGVVSAEELRRQLAEALPGATSIMVEAYNNLHPAQQVTMEEFIKLQEAGKILSNEILPEFANVLENRLAPALAGKINSLDASIEKVTTQFFLLKTAVTDTEFVKFFTDTFGEHLKRINAIINSESVPALEKLSRIMLEYMALGSLNSSVIEKQIAKEQMAAAASAKINKDILDEAKRIMGLKKTQRDEELKSLKEEADSYVEALDQAKKMNEERDAEIAKINQKFYALKKNAVSSNEAYGLEKQREKEVADVKARYFDYEQSNILKQKQTRFDVINGILQEVESAINQEIKAEKAKNKELKDLEKQRLQDEVANAEAAVLRAQKGSIEEANAYANLADKKKDLNEFMAKSDATMQLARLKGEIETNEKVEEARTKTADALSDIVVEEEIDPSKDPALKRIDKELETYAKNKDKISEAIAAPFMSAMAKEEVEAVSHYLNLISLTEENSEERKRLEEALYQELDNIRQRSADKDQDREETRLRRLSRAMSQTVNAIGGLFQDSIQLSIDASNQELLELERRNEQGLISEEEYQKQKENIQRRVFENEKAMQVARAVMSGANAILSIIGNPTLAPLAPVLIPITAGLTAAQISQIQAQTPGFKDGVIDLQGPGTESSDSIVARLSKGESVMTAKETRKYKDVLEAIREDRLPGLIAEKYLIPAYESSMNREKKPDLNKTSMELAFQTAELVQAVKSNKVINLSDKSVNRLASAMNRTKAMDKKIRRRGL